MTFTLNRLFARKSLLIGAVAITIAGCSGGLGGSGSPGSCTSNTYTPNYAVQGDLYYWGRFPLKVAFVDNGLLTTARRDLTLQGFQTWSSATSGLVEYQVVSDLDSANIIVEAVPLNGTTLGLTSISASGARLRSARVKIGFTGNNAEDFNTAAHEFGHALGLLGHSDVRGDMMFTSGNTNGCNCLTQRDINTLLTAYCNNFSRRTAPKSEVPEGPIVERTIRCNIKHTH